MKKGIIVFIFLIILSIAVPVHAASLTESQIQAIIGLVRSFGVDAVSVANVAAALRGTAVSQPAASVPTMSSPQDGCGFGLMLTQTLYASVSDATTGGQVTYLQKFLAADSLIYPEGLVTGYFGPATEKAVQRWQGRNGVVTAGTPSTTGFGLVGSLTRDAIKKLCTGVGAVTTPPPSTVIAPSLNSAWATIDSFTADSLAPTIPGSASGVVSVTLSLVNNGVVAYTSGPLMVTNGKWSHTVTSALAEGTYVMHVRGPDNKLLASGSLVMYSSLVQPPSVTISALPLSIPIGGESKISWSTANASQCLLKYGSIEEPVAVNGSKTITLQSTATYTLWCANDSSGSGNGPSASNAVTVTVSGAPTCTLDQTKVVDAFGNTTAQYKLTWTSTNADYAKVKYAYGNTAISPSNLPDVGASGNITVSHTSLVTYTMTFYGAGGTAVCSVPVGY